MEKRQPNYFIYFAAISICFITFSSGLTYSWTSPLLPKFESNDSNVNPIGRPLTTSESGLMVSMINVGLVCTTFAFGLIVGNLGKKSTLLISGIPLLVAHIMCSVATSFEEFLAARFLMGVSSAGTWSILPGYVSEISEPKNRGILGSLMLVLYCLGGLFATMTGPFLSVKWFSIVNLIPISLFLVVVYVFIPDSPYDLVMKNDIQSAKQSLIKLRQYNDVEKELSEIEWNIKSNAGRHTKFRDIFTDKASSTALVICGGLMIFNSCSGSLIVMGYTQTIFDLAGGAIPSSYSAIIVGLVSVLATIMNSYLIDRLGRRPIIILSCAVASIAHASLGIFFHLLSSGSDVNKFQWLPICSVISFVFAYNFGLGPLPWVVLGEVLPSNIKAVGSTFCISINFGLNLLITLIYPYLLESIGISNAFLFFSITLLFGVIFCFLKLPETKGKSFEEIYALLGGNSKS